MRPFPPRVKICGITHVDDIPAAAAAGADAVGFVFAAASRRRVTLAQAVMLAALARAAGLETAGVFVEQNADEIRRVQAATGIDILQLHGDIARDALPRLPLDTGILYAVAVDSGGSYGLPDPARRELASRPRAALLLDQPAGGSGSALPWPAMRAPALPWLLAGGLTQENVSEAVTILRPAGVDVSGGVCLPGSARKCPERMRAFIRAARAALEA